MNREQKRRIESLERHTPADERVDAIELVSPDGTQRALIWTRPETANHE